MIAAVFMFAPPPVECRLTPILVGSGEFFKRKVKRKEVTLSPPYGKSSQPQKLSADREHRKIPAAMRDICIAAGMCKLENM